MAIKVDLKKTIAGTVLTAGLLLGGTTAAFAADAPPTTPKVSAECKAAARSLHELRVLDRRLRADYRHVQRLRDAAAKAGKDDLVARLDARLEKAKAAHAKVVAKIKAKAAEVREECAPAAA
ncbi:MAG: hypothetical protein U0P45_14855 [Acidimicrobiales bacterium]